MCQCQFPRFPRARAPRRSIPGGAERGSAPRVPPAPCPRAKIERALAACMKNSRSVRRGILLSPQPARVRLITEFNCRSGNKYDLIRYKPTQTNVIFFALAAALGFTKDDGKQKSAAFKAYDFSMGGTDNFDQRAAAYT